MQIFVWEMLSPEIQSQFSESPATHRQPPGMYWERSFSRHSRRRVVSLLWVTAGRLERACLGWLAEGPSNLALLSPYPGQLPDERNREAGNSFLRRSRHSLSKARVEAWKSLNIQEERLKNLP